jgi:nucleoside-diphosphate-sugar epimerase
MSDQGVMIFGATGPTGKMLVQSLCDAGIPVVAVLRDESRIPEFEAYGAVVAVGDAMDRNGTQKIMQAHGDRVSTVLNLIGGSPMGDADKWPDYEGNVNVIDASAAVGIDYFVFVTSVGTGSSERFVPGEAFIRPLLALKSRAEDHLKRSSLDWVIIKPGGLGPEGTVVPGGEVLVTENDSVRGLLAREDLANIVLHALENKKFALGKELYVVAEKIVVAEGEATPFVW